MMKALKFFERIIQSEHELKLMRFRNIDAIMLCCLFCSLSYNDNSISWKSILDSYRKQPQYCDHTISRIYMGDGRPREHIFDFYRKSFIPIVKQTFDQMNVREASQALTAIGPLWLSACFTNSFQEE